MTFSSCNLKEDGSNGTLTFPHQTSSFVFLSNTTLLSLGERPVLKPE
jgi:hypothetical protein